MYNFNKLFPRLSIGTKLIIAFAGLSFFPLALLGLYTIVSSIHLMERIALENLEHDVRIIHETSQNFLAGVQTDLQFLKNSPPMGRLASMLKGSRRSVDPTVLQQVGEELLAFAETKGIYYQLRIAAENGDELLRVEAQTVTAARSMHRVIFPDDRYRPPELWHFFLAENLAEDEAAFAPAELVHERSKEFVPVITFVTPITNAGDRVGILIAYVFARDFFQAVETKKQHATVGTVVLVNAEGHFIYHSEKKNHWNKLLAFRDEDNLHHYYPTAVAAAILSGEEGTVTEGIDEIISYGPLFPRQETLQAREPFTGLAAPLVVFKSVPKDAILGPVHSFAWIFGGTLLLFLVTAIGLALLATKQFTRPIGELKQGADVISRGTYEQRLHIDTNDEIEELAEAFNRMAESLEAHEKEIQRHRTKLEELVNERTVELTDERNKLQAIIDNVPSALILLDKNLWIQSVSAAFPSITNHPIEEVRGKVCRICPDFGVPIEQCPSRRALLSGRTESSLINHNGGNAFFEHVAVPINRDGRVEAILEIITDITDRKRLQDQIVRAEKAIAVGEMSAVIAHEIRNSLTSIKLILQYFSESQKLRSRREKESINVAMNSTHRLEQIVNDLLNFAKPREMKFSLLDVNQVVKESITFSRRQLERKRISLIEHLKPELPKLAIDGPSLKQALVNLLLNAADAVGEEAGVITIQTASFELRETIRDPLPDYQSLSQGPIKLEKGKRVVSIEISDNGCGIPPHHLERIFGPFFTTKTEGTGLGLTMAKRVVDEHGGIILVESQEGRGSTFRILLPAQRENP